jgi:choline dehydrogenase-like flavoprotein
VTVVVVGSGPSGVHFALTLLRKGIPVTMVDGGRPPPAPVEPDAAWHELREQLEDPAAYFLGERLEGVLLPSESEEYYGIPPHKQYIFDAPDAWKHSSTGFAPLFSFAQGGLAEAWTGGCYPFNDAELEAFPFGYDRLGPFYDEVARRIGVSGLDDDMARFTPVHGHLQRPIEPDPSSTKLLAAYERNRARLNRRLGFYMGRSRVATLTEELGGRKPCTYLGRCLWGCPTGSLYTPSLTLAECLASPLFTYRPGLYVTHFLFDDDRRITSVAASPLEGGEQIEIPVQRLALAAGALSSTRVLLESVRGATGEIVRLGGLMDNRQALVPFSHLRMLGKSFEPRSYQYNQICLGLEGERPAEYVHGLVTTLTTALIHPIAQQLPLDLGSATFVTRAVHSTLGVVNVNFHDTRRDENQVWLQPGTDGVSPTLTMSYRPDADEPRRVREAVATVRAGLHRLACVVPPGMAHMRPMGASVHYAGTLPMTGQDRPWTTRPDGSSRDFRNLHVVDGATFPFLPAKNLTFTLMANAVRIADEAF